MRFVDSSFDREGRLSLGHELDSFTRCLSIPVSRSLTDYEDDRLVLKPGWNRGTRR